MKNVPDLVFTEDERREIVEEWNDHLGAEMAKIIVRKPKILRRTILVLGLVDRGKIHYQVQREGFRQATDPR